MPLLAYCIVFHDICIDGFPQLFVSQCDICPEYSKRPQCRVRILAIKYIISNLNFAACLGDVLVGILSPRGHQAGTKSVKHWGGDAKMGSGLRKLQRNAVVPIDDPLRDNIFEGLIIIVLVNLLKRSSVGIFVFSLDLD